MASEQTERTANHPAAGKARIARLLRIEHHCPGLPEPGVMRKNWPFRVGLMLFLAQGLVVMSGQPIALGLVSLSCLGCLLVGLFQYTNSDIGISSLVGYALLTAFLTVLAGRALFLAAESLTYDTSADSHVAYVVIAAWAAAAGALVYGIVRRLRNRKNA
jgi:hypothetical protein